MNRRVLWVDDEPNVLTAVRRLLRGSFEVETAERGDAALELIRTKGPYAVVVSDRQMPGMDGVELLARIRRTAPETVRVMFTGLTDRQTAVEAINEGNIFRFLAKPVDPEQMTATLEAAVEQHRLVTAEKELLQRTLSGAVRILTDVLSLTHPAAFGHAARVRSLVTSLCEEVRDPNGWQTEIAANLSQIGLIAVPELVLRRVLERGSLVDDDEPLFDSHPAAGKALISNIPRLEGVAEVVSYQHQRWDGSGFPGDGREGLALPLGARILKVAQDFDLLTGAGVHPETALLRMRARRHWYDPTVFDALVGIVSHRPKGELRVGIHELEPGMVLNSDIVAPGGAVLVRSGQQVTEAVRQRLRYFEHTLGPEATVAVAATPSPRHPPSQAA